MQWNFSPHDLQILSTTSANSLDSAGASGPAPYAGDIINAIKNPDGTTTLTPNEGFPSAVDVKGASSFFQSLQDLVTGKTLGGLATRGGLEIIGGIFLIFGFIMLAMRSNEAVRNSEVGHTVSKLTS